MLGTQRARGAQVPGLRQNPRSCELDSATKSGYCRTQGHCVTGCPDARTHRRVPRPGATGNAVRAAHRDRRRSEMRSPWAGRARASPGRSSAAPPSPAAAPRRGPSAAATGRPGGRRASPSRSPSPPAALRPRRRPQLSGAGRAPAEKNPRQAPPRRRAPPRPRPPSCFPPPPLPADVRLRASRGRVLFGSPRSRRLLRSTWPAGFLPGSFRGRSLLRSRGSRLSLCCPPRPRAHTDSAPTPYEEIEPGLRVRRAVAA